MSPHLALFLSLLCLAAPFIRAHSMMSEPEGISPNVCRMGGAPNPGRCPGPCDTTALLGRFANFDSPANPAAIYRRGQRVRTIYQRNNHGPGGFVRLTLVPVHQMMSKAAHARNAFYYSCFGAHPVVASKPDMAMRPHRFSLVGNDGFGRPHQTGYYYDDVVVPKVVPDGDYVLGWVWYGGTGGPVSNKPYTHPPFWKGYFGDYWSCSFVRIEGGAELERQHTPVFDNSMSKFSSEGCMSANDSPGVCIYEPCVVYSKFQKPREFKNGAVPPPLTPAHFAANPTSDRSAGATPGPPPFAAPTNNPVTPKDEKLVVDDDVKRKINACKCINMGENCSAVAAGKTAGCLPKTAEQDQPRACQKDCCDVCSVGYPVAANDCIRRRVKEVCGF